jgi:hypothetical protein
LFFHETFYDVTRGDRHAISTNGQSRRIQKHPLGHRIVYEKKNEFSMGIVMNFRLYFFEAELRPEIKNS